MAKLFSDHRFESLMFFFLFCIHSLLFFFIPFHWGEASNEMSVGRKMRRMRQSREHRKSSRMMLLLLKMLWMLRMSTCSRLMMLLRLCWEIHRRRNHALLRLEMLRMLEMVRMVKMMVKVWMLQEGTWSRSREGDACWLGLLSDHTVHHVSIQLSNSIPDSSSSSARSCSSCCAGEHSRCLHEVQKDERSISHLSLVVGMLLLLLLLLRRREEWNSKRRLMTLLRDSNLLRLRTTP